MFSNVWKTIILIVAASHYIYSEPQCSRFHYEEKMLEKMIRLEFTVENIKKEVKDIQNQAKTTLGELQTERIAWDNKLMTLKENGILRLDNAIQDTKAEIEKEVKKLTEKRESLEQLKESLKEPDVLFSVRTATNTLLTANQPMVYANVILNKGGGYKPDGMFTAPYAGVYIFTVQFCTIGRRIINFAFMVNNTAIRLSQIHGFYGSSTSFDAMTTVKRHDVVWIKIVSAIGSGNHLVDTSSTCWNTFSGVLIHNY